MYDYDICVVTLDRDVLADKYIKNNVEIALLPIDKQPEAEPDCDVKSTPVNATGWGYFHGCMSYIFFIMHTN